MSAHLWPRPTSASAQRPAPSPDGSAATRLIEQELPALRQRLLRHASFAVRDHGLAEDLVQDTLVAVVQQHATRRGESSLLTWSMAILKHKIADWYRSPAQRRTVPLTLDHDALGGTIDALYDAQGAYADPIPAWQQPDQQLERRQMMAVLERCISCLPSQTGRVFMMREWLGFETPEICERLNVSADNCRTILHRARMALRVCMQRDWIGNKAKS